ncbi:hypothetical protein VNO80_22883 [Phaseolus coccineus]|uniref:Uncharacterized protein n=1 Tax=Phaseolus coccineus TaxID=3886 RepID=A0AAN9M4X9_PHACN
MGGVRRCAMVVVLRLPEWCAQVRDGGGAAHDVASVGTLMALIAFSGGQVFNMLRSAAKLSPIAHMREFN